MKFNLANPTTGTQKSILIDDDKKLRQFYDKRIAQEVEGDVLGDEYKGYVFKITGGNDKEGFPMMQGILQASRVRLLLDKDSKCYRPRRTGERKRKSIRGCIVGPDLSVLNLVVLKKGPAEIPGLTDRNIPRRLGPKRANKIRKLFNLTKKDDVRKYVVRREVVPKPKELKEGEQPKPARKYPKIKAPKIQRLVTPLTLQRKRHRLALKKKRSLKSKIEAAEYAKLVVKRLKQKREGLLNKGTSTKITQRDSKKLKAALLRAQKTEKAAKGGKVAAKSTKDGKGKAAKPAAGKDTKAAKPAVGKDAKAAKPAAAGKGKDAKAAKPATGKDAKAAKPGKAGKPAATKDAKAAKPAAAKDAKAGKAAKPAAGKDAKAAKPAAATKDAKAAKPAKDAKTAKPATATKDTKAAKPAAAKDAKAAKPAAATKDAKPAAKPSKPAKEAKSATPKGGKK